MYLWDVYHEPADSDELARFIGPVLADTMALVLDRTAEFYEIPSYDLIVKRSDKAGDV